MSIVKKAQVSMEYLMLIGFVFAITIPLLALYYSYSTEANDKLIANQLDQIAKQIVDAADSVYYLGEPSQTTLKVFIPDNIAEASLSGREVIFKMRTKGGLSDIVGLAEVNMTGSLPSTKGIHFVTVKASGNNVNITST